MARVTFTQEDILRSKLVKPGWYPVLVSKFTEDTAGTDGSALFVYELKIESGSYKDVPLRFQVSEKALGMGIEFVEACGFAVVAGQPMELEKCLGKHIDAFVQRGEYKFKGNNQAVSFRKRQEETARA